MKPPANPTATAPTRANALHRLASGCAVVLALTTTGVHAATPAPLEACNANAFQTVLSASPALANAPAPQAVWLNRQLLQWPGSTPSGRFALHYSRTGQLRATIGSPVNGSGGALALDVFTAPLPTAITQRFGYLKPGVVLAVQAARVPAQAARAAPVVVARRAVQAAAVALHQTAVVLAARVARPAAAMPTAAARPMAIRLRAMAAVVGPAVAAIPAVLAAQLVQSLVPLGTVATPQVARVARVAL